MLLFEFTGLRASLCMQSFLPFVRWFFFSEAQLAVLGDISSSIACECPQHLTELVNGLSNFEDYSAECVSQSPKDAELHTYLQSVTANCRASMEEALEKVAIAEGINLDELI